MSSEEVPTAPPAVVANSRIHTTLEAAAARRPPLTHLLRFGGTAINESGADGRLQRLLLQHQLLPTSPKKSFLNP